MGDQSLGSLSAKLELGTDGLDASVAKAVGGLNKVEAATKKTEKEVEHVGKTLQKALKGEVLVNAFNRMGSAVTSLGKDFKGLGEAITGFGAVLQGLFQGGLQGAAIAAAGVGVAYLVKQFGELQDMVDATEKATAAVAASMSAGYAKVAASMEDVTRKLQVQNDAKTLGISLTEAEFRLRSQEIQGSITTLRASAAGSLRLADQASEGLHGGGGAPAAFRAAAARDTFEADQKVAQLKLLESTLRLDKATTSTVKPLSAFAQAMKEARAWTVGGAGLELSPGEAARADEIAKGRMRLGDMRDPDGSIASEARDRAERNAGYRANAATTITGDGDAERASKERSKALRRMQSGDDIREMNEVLQSMVDDIKDLTFAEQLKTTLDGLIGEISRAAGTVAEVMSGVAPKTTDIIGKILAQDYAGAAASAMKHSKEMQAVGDMLDKSLVDSINKITVNLRPMLPVISVGLKVLVAAFELLGNLVGLASTTNGLEVSMWALFEGLKWFGAGVAGVAAVLKWISNAIKDVMAEAAIAVLSLGGDFFKDQIEQLKAGKSGQAGLDVAWKEATDSFLKLTYSGELAAMGLDGAAASAEKVAQSFLNLPAGFKVASAIYDATGASGEAFGGFTPPSASGMPPLAAAAAGGTGSGSSGSGDVFNFYGPIYVAGDEGFTNVVTVSARQSGMTGRGSTAGQPPPQRPTPYPPNGSQPYTPVP